MKDEKEQVEIFEEEEILTFTDDEGKDVQLCQIACVEHNGDFYSLLENYSDDETDDEDGVYIYKILNYDENDKPLDLEPVETEELANEIFAKFMKVYNENYGGCDCGCCDEDCCEDEEEHECGEHCHCHKDN